MSDFVTVGDVWDQVEPWIASAISEDFDAITIRYVKDQVFSGKDTLWTVEDDAGELVGAAVSMVEHLPNGKKVVGVLAAGGEGAIEYKDKWERLLDSLDVYGYQIGAQEVRLVGRAAFKKIFSEHGFKQRYTVLGRPIVRRN